MVSHFLMSYCVAIKNKEMDAFPWGGGGVTAYDGPYGKAPLVEAYKRVGKSVIWVCERVQKG